MLFHQFSPFGLGIDTFLLADELEPDHTHMHVCFLFLGDLPDHFSAAIVAISDQPGRQTRSCIQATRLLHHGHHRQPRQEVVLGGDGALPEPIVRIHVAVAASQLFHPQQAPAQVSALVVGHACEVDVEFSRHALAGETCHGVPRQVDCVELHVRQVVQHVCVRRQWRVGRLRQRTHRHEARPRWTRRTLHVRFATHEKPFAMILRFLFAFQPQECRAREAGFLHRIRRAQHQRRPTSQAARRFLPLLARRRRRAQQIAGPSKAAGAMRHGVRRRRMKRRCHGHET
mmetsp:Transcript_1246/g.4840  ORF Transcript_1246/g.4840 Transcript_1246/m.4840 type:complete len:286 (+) Transcript_1246:380-1237(+)